MFHLRTVLLSALLCAAPVWADQPPPPQTPEEIVITEGREQPGAQPPAEPVPPPEVRMIQRPDAVIEEFRQAGRLVMVRIAPRFGPPYYLVDTDGDGSLETRRYPLDAGPVPQWMLLNW